MKPFNFQANFCMIFDFVVAFSICNFSLLHAYCSSFVAFSAVCLISLLEIRVLEDELEHDFDKLSPSKIVNKNHARHSLIMKGLTFRRPGKI